MYCPNCGKEITQVVRYCPYCGYDLKSGTTVNSAEDGSYKLVLVSRGSCPADTCSDLLCDVFDYPVSKADQLVSLAPVEIAAGLTGEQADVIAQMFTEYGAKVSILDKDDEFINRNAASRSIFNSDGSLIASAAAIIGTIALANQVTSYRRFTDRPGIFDCLFHTMFEPAPPRHYHRFHPEPWLDDEPGRRNPHPMDNHGFLDRPPHGRGPGGRGPGFGPR